MSQYYDATYCSCSFGMLYFVLCIVLIHYDRILFMFSFLLILLQPFISIFRHWTYAVFYMLANLWVRA